MFGVNTNISYKLFLFWSRTFMWNIPFTTNWSLTTFEFQLFYNLKFEVQTVVVFDHQYKYRSVLCWSLYPWSVLLLYLSYCLYLTVLLLHRSGQREILCVLLFPFLFCSHCDVTWERVTCDVQMLSNPPLFCSLHTVYCLKVELLSASTGCNLMTFVSHIFHSVDCSHWIWTVDLWSIINWSLSQYTLSPRVCNRYNVRVDPLWVFPINPMHIVPQNPQWMNGLPNECKLIYSLVIISYWKY